MHENRAEVFRADSLLGAPAEQCHNQSCVVTVRLSCHVSTKEFAMGMGGRQFLQFPTIVL